MVKSVSCCCVRGSRLFSDLVTITLALQLGYYLHYKNNTINNVHISELHQGYDPLQYPLIFPFGTDSWQINLELQNGKKLTCSGLYYDGSDSNINFTQGKMTINTF